MNPDTDSYLTPRARPAAALIAAIVGVFVAGVGASHFFIGDARAADQSRLERIEQKLNEIAIDVAVLKAAKQK